MKHILQWLLTGLVVIFGAITCGCSVDTDDAYQQGGAGGAHNVPTGGGDGGQQGGVAGSQGEAVYVAHPDELRPIPRELATVTVAWAWGAVEDERGYFTEARPEEMPEALLTRWCRAVDVWRRAVPFEDWRCVAVANVTIDTMPRAADVWHITTLDSSDSGWLGRRESFFVSESSLSERCALSQMVRAVGRLVGGADPYLRDSVDGAVMRENNQCEITPKKDDVEWLNNAILSSL